MDDDKQVKSYEQKRDLPRLRREWYQGRAWVFWTHTLDKRATGWLDDAFHFQFREIALHAQVREWLACPLYVLMPDHLHLVWIGSGEESDQLRASRLLRTELNRLLHPKRLQKQPHDHVLRDEEREVSVFGGTWEYIARNPERAALVKDWRGYAFLGSLVPGYTGLDPRADEFFSSFWKVFRAFSNRRS